VRYAVPALISITDRKRTEIGQIISTLAILTIISAAGVVRRFVLAGPLRTPRGNARTE
jgi:hypothetical protein